MEIMLQICGIGILAAILASVLKRENVPHGTLLTTACCIMIAFAALQLMQPVITFLQTLRQTANLNDDLMLPLLKTVGIGLLTQVTAAICQDAGQAAVAKMVELCGSVAALYLSLPLLTAVLDLLNQLTGG